MWSHRPRQPRDAAARRLRVTLAVLASALESGDPLAAARILHPRVVLVVDTGAAAQRTVPVTGADDAAWALIFAVRSRGAVVLAEESVNGGPGLSLRADGRVVGIVVGELRRRRLACVWVVLNPDKLRHWNPTA